MEDITDRENSNIFVYINQISKCRDFSRRNLTFHGLIWGFITKALVLTGLSLALDRQTQCTISSPKKENVQRDEF